MQGWWVDERVSTKTLHKGDNEFRIVFQEDKRKKGILNLRNSVHEKAAA